MRTIALSNASAKLCSPESSGFFLPPLLAEEAVAVSPFSAVAVASTTPSDSFSVFSAVGSAAVSCASLAFATAFSSSFILVITSLIIQSGVDAPATIPIIPLFLTISSVSSQEFSIHTVFLQFFLHILYNFWVFELFLPPITITQSHNLLKASASSCLFFVVSHIVSWISTFLKLFFKYSAISLYALRINVV